jgi:AhpD family alkylhydroperoxidase
MSKDYPAVAKDLTALYKDLNDAIPETMEAFRGLAKASLKRGALDAKTKELLAVAIAIAIRCDGCLAFHVRAALRHGATREEIADTIAVAIDMGGGPGTIYGAYALQAYDQFVEETRG